MLVQEYCQLNFVDAGMCVDFNIHNPKKPLENVHAHILLTMRPLNPDGSWGDKQKKEYMLNKNGEKIYDKKKRQYKCKTVQTTDWNEHSKTEEWRQAWAYYANKNLEKNGFAERIDHRSYERQGIEQIPTIHLGVAASQMERKGIATEKGDINRAIAEDNKLIRAIKAQIASLTTWIKNAITQSENAEPSLIDVLWRYKESREERYNNYSAYGNQQVQISDLKSISEAVAYLQNNHIVTLEQMEQHLQSLRTKTFELNDSVKQSERRMKELNEMIQTSNIYTEIKSVYERYRKISNAKSQQIFYDANTADLIRYDAAKSKLDKLLADNKLHIREWQAEYRKLSAARDSDYGKLLSVRERVKEGENIRKQVEFAMQIIRPQKTPQKGVELHV